MRAMFEKTKGDEKRNTADPKANQPDKIYRLIMMERLLTSNQP